MNSLLDDCDVLKVILGMLGLSLTVEASVVACISLFSWL